MTMPKHPKICSQGFSIIESIVVLLIIGVIALVLVSMQGRLWLGSIAGSDYQAATLAQQKCAEKVILSKRQFGYSAINATLCSSQPAITGVTMAIVPGSLVTCDGAVSLTGTCASGLQRTLEYKDVQISAGQINPVTVRVFR